MSTHTVWHDCDPGTDDAITLLTLLGSPNVNLVGVSTTHGNAPLSATTRNALALLHLAGKSAGGVPVYAGAAAPLVRQAVYAPEIHGESGLGSVVMPPSHSAQALHGALALAQHLLKHPHQTTVLATGPLSNLALAERLFPGVLQLARQLIVMGGSWATQPPAPKLGNVTPYAEFNAYADPHALHVVLRSGARPALLGLNLTRQVQVTAQRAEQVCAVGTQAAQTCATFMRDYLARLGQLGQSIGALHDPCTAALMLNPELFERQDAHLEVLTDSGEHLGHTLRGSQAANASLITKADEAGVYDVVCAALARLP